MSGQLVHTRRSVIRCFVLGTAGSLVAGKWLVRPVLAASPPPILQPAVLRLTTNQFPALNNAGGSLRLEVGLEKPVIINRGAAGFYAVSSKCQHQGCTVNPYDPSLGVMRCPCHGSRYNIDGSLNQGPALRGLDVFPIAFDGASALTVQLADATNGTREISLVSTSASGSRFKLTFNAVIFTSYQILYRASLAEEPQVVPFSLTPAGPATQSTYRNGSFDPADPLPAVDLWVDAPSGTGFFAIALLPTEN